MSLHVHSEFSSLDGWSSCDEIADRMQEIDCCFCGLTDHGVVSGHLDFDKAMRKRNLNPVFGCLMEGQSIVTTEGRKNVEDVRVGDLVLTHKGRFRSVARIMQRPYRGQGFDIKIAQTKRTLRLTEEHPVLIREISGEVTWKNPGDIKPTVKWEGCGNLNGPSVCLPKLEDGPAVINVLDWLPEYFETNRLGYIGRRKQKKGDHDCWWPAIPPMILLSPEIARFLGLYVAEGSAKPNGQITFTFNINEDGYAQFVHAVLQSFHVNAKIYHRPDKTIQEVVACNVPLALMLRGLCGIGALSKHVPPPIFNSNRHVREAFLAGVDQGDGRKTTPQKMIKVGSRDLCWGLRTILADLGHWTSVVDLGPRSYQIQWSPDAKYKRTREDDQYLYRMINSITPCDIDCDVYNFEVEEDNSYVSDFILHNCELYHGAKFDQPMKKNERDQAHLIALAITDEGLRNLWRLVNATSDRKHFHHVGRVTNEDILKYKEGIQFTSACPLGLVPQGLLKGDTTWLNWYLDNLGDQFHLEITTYPGDAIWKDIDAEGEEMIYTPQVINERIIEVGEERGIEIKYGDDGHYSRLDQFELHDAYLAAQTKQSIYTPVEERKMWHPKGAVCIKDEKMVREALHYLPKSTVDAVIESTMRTGETANAHLPTVDRPHLPVFIPKDCPYLCEDEIDKNIDATSLFIELVQRGIGQRYPSGSENEEKAWEKAVHETEVLCEDHLEHYFLMAWDVIQFCKKKGIKIGPGRGSSAGSIVAYALGITDVDPLHYDLYFERFWNKGRTEGFPDIDTDFQKSRREEIREYLIERWGRDRVCSIGTITRMKPLAVIEKMHTACEISYSDMEHLKRIVRQTPRIDIHGVDQIGWSRDLEPGKVIYVEDAVREQILEWINEGDTKKRKKFVEICEYACSRNSTYGIHASGIVVADIDLADYAPAYRRGGKEGIPATMFPMSDIDKLKLIKLDVLGLKTLDTLDEWDKQMQTKGIETVWSGLDRQEHPNEMWDLMEEGFVAGIFQCETKTGKALTERLKPRSVEELGLLVALVRPGPDEWEYIHRKEGRIPVTYPHPILEPILEQTYGMFVYQEQIIAFMSALGYTLGEADAVRKVLGKKQPEKLSEIFEGFNDWDKHGFLKVAMEKGFSEEVATNVWIDIEAFASYSFNKSHAIAYAIVGLHTLYAKFYGPQEFYIACIRTVPKDKRAELVPEYIKEARRAGIKVLPPDIRYSQGRVDTHDGHIYFGFGDVKGVGIGGDYIAYLRDELNFPIYSHEAFSEMLDAYNDSENERKKTEEMPEGWKSPKQQLNEKKLLLIAESGAWDEVEEIGVDLKEKQRFEEELLGVVVTDNSEEILAAHEDEIEGCDSWDEAMLSWDEKESDPELAIDWTNGESDEIPLSQRRRKYRLPGIITGVKPTKVKASGAPMGIITMEYGRHELQFACFSNKWPNSKFMFKPHNVGIFVIQHSPSTSRREGYNFETGHLLS